MAAFHRLGCSLVFLAAVVSAHAAPHIADGIAAVVNDKVIPYSEVSKRVDDTEKILRETYKGPELVTRIKEARLNALRALIERELIIQDFKKQGYFIPDTIVQDRLHNTIQTQYEGDRTAFIRTIQAQGLSLEQFKEELRDSVIVQAMRSKNVSDNVIVSPYKVEQYYQDNAAQFTQEAQIRLGILFLRKSLFPKKDADGKEVDPAANIAKELLFKLDSGASFGDLARSYSEGPKRSEGGDIGWVKRGDLRPEIADVAFTLQPGQTSRVITCSDGYYIVRVEDRKRAEVEPMSDVRAQIEQTLVEEDRERLQQEWLDRLRAKAFIKTAF